MLYEKKYEFRYGDLDKNGNIKVAAILDVLQDISISHSADVGLGLKELYSRSLAWLLEGWRIKFITPLNESKITVKTGIMKMHHFSSYRKYEIWQDGILKIQGTASWFSVNTETLRPAIVPEEISSAYVCLDEPENNLPFLKLRPKESPEFIAENSVGKRDLDTNNHMNNVKSAEIALELLPEGSEMSELQVTYRKAIMPSDAVKQCGCVTENGYYAELKNGNDETCVLVNVIMK